jgi:hypothetical protein
MTMLSALRMLWPRAFIFERDGTRLAHQKRDRRGRSRFRLSGRPASARHAAPDRAYGLAGRLGKAELGEHPQLIDHAPVLDCLAVDVARDVDA